MEFTGAVKIPVAPVEEDLDVLRLEIRYRQVTPAIAVEVANGDGVRKRSGTVHGRVAERSGTVAEENADVPLTFIHHGQIMLAIAVEVGNGNGVGRQTARQKVLSGGENADSPRTQRRKCKWPDLSR
jgi:hypothetical protein